MADEELDAALVEHGTQDVCNSWGEPTCSFPACGCSTPPMRGAAEKAFRSAIRSLGIPAAALNALWRREAVVVPKEPTREMLNALWVAKVPDDWQAGQRAQSKLGADRVPPSYIAEETWGQYERALAASPFAAKK